MKAITLHQPWASLLVLGEKRLETRSWATRHRGLLAVHAAARIPPHALALMQSNAIFRRVARRRDLDPERLPLGAVLGVVRLLDCRPADAPALAPLRDAQERAFGDFAPGRHAWLVEVAEVFDPPRPARGYPGLWDWRGR